MPFLQITALYVYRITLQNIIFVYLNHVLNAETEM